MDRDGSGFDLRFSMRLRAFSVVQDLTYKNSSNSTIFCKFLLENIERSKYTISKTSGIYLFSTFIGAILKKARPEKPAERQCDWHLSCF